MKDIKLPAVTGQTMPALKALTEALGIPREVLASDEEIETAWNNLPRVLKKIPPQLRNENLARMCVAVASGLFDSAINYIWNLSVIELREKVKRFGLNVVSQIRGKQFDESTLLDFKDAELLNLCLELNLITEDGFFFLDQCRDIRNNFSAAHPAVGSIDDNEFISFVNRCAKYALGYEYNLVGVDIQEFIQAINGPKFVKSQINEWVDRLSRTHEAQREMLFGTLHGIFSDPGSSEEARLNSLFISSKFVDQFTPKTKSDLIDRHSEYLAKGNVKRHKASQLYFEKLGMIGLLGESERHSLISVACKHLLSVHQGVDNFYNEPPFAERLLQLSSQGSMPDTAKYEFVTTVVTCAVGNPYGTSHAADPYYTRMIKGFTPREVAIMLDLRITSTIVAQRIKSYPRCRKAFICLVSLIDHDTVPTKYKTIYKKIVG
ncbi:MAG: hypothetical protein JYX80_13625 [Candidatus Scalindua sediminis]|nr:hypothetical protein [Candidatus Scalindua sediminis]